MEASDFLFRASSIGEIMSGTGKNMPVEKSVTCMRKLVQMYREMAWKRRPDFSNKYTKKGTLAEDSGIDLYCIHKGIFYRKNTERKNNQYFTGEWDLDDAKNGGIPNETIDIKCSWSPFTFPSIVDKISKAYEYQGEVYMNLTGSKKHTVAYCLVNTPASIILKEKRRLSYEHGIIDIETDDYIEACMELEKNSIFDTEAFMKEYPYFEFHTPKKLMDFDIPAKERIFEVVSTENKESLDKMIARILECRQWITKNLLK